MTPGSLGVLSGAFRLPRSLISVLRTGPMRSLRKAGATDVTDDAMIVEAFTDTKVRLVEGSYENIKITTPEDLKIAEAFLKGI